MKLHYETVSPLLLECLQKLMRHPAFDQFYLVGETSLSLQRYPWTASDADIRNAFTRISMMSDCTEVNCLKGKYWEFIVEDLQEESKLCFL